MCSTRSTLVGLFVPPHACGIPVSGRLGFRTQGLGSPDRVGAVTLDSVTSNNGTQLISSLTD